MKIIALLMVKDESWILPSYLAGIKPIVDEIVAMDDGSTDNTKQILLDAGATVLENKEVWKSGTPEYSMRQRMLDEGRRRGGTHFVCLDADEVISEPFRSKAREKISLLKPGQKYTMQWLFLWEDPNLYINDKRSLFKDSFKDLIFCDSPEMSHSFKFMHVGRTPGSSDSSKLIKIDPAEGVCLHFTFVNWKRCMMKQAWCRCSDLINEPGRHVKINNKYFFPEKSSKFIKSKVKPEWMSGVKMPQNFKNLPPSWHLKTILGFFNNHGIEFFEPLEIWDIEELRNEFKQRTGRYPQSSRMHIYLQPFIKLRRQIKKAIYG